jgi:hypothetical protein
MAAKASTARPEKNARVIIAAPLNSYFNYYCGTAGAAKAVSC